MEASHSSPPAWTVAVAPEPARQAHDLGALLLGATERCVRVKLRSVRAAGFTAVSEPQLTLFYHLPPEGMRLTALAAQANLTKPSMLELVDRAEAMRLVERRPDPGDRRAKVVELTAGGAALLASLRDGVVAAERMVRDVFGASLLLEVRRRLDEYSGQGGFRPADAVDADHAWRFQNIVRTFSLSARRFSREALAFAHDRGWRSVSEVSLVLFRNLDRDGSRLSDIASATRMTKQSMGELVDQAELLGLVRRLPDPADGRAKRIAFTSDGRAMLDDMRLGLRLAEDGFRREAGGDLTERLRERLRALARA